MNTKAPIRYAHIDGTDRSGYEYGVDYVTPVLWKFQNRAPAKVYTTYDLAPFHKNEKVQAWLQANQTVIISFSELRRKLLDLIKEEGNE